MDTEVQRALQTLRRAGIQPPLTDPSDWLAYFTEVLEQAGYLWLCSTGDHNHSTSHWGELIPWCRYFHSLHKSEPCGSNGGKRHCDLDFYTAFDETGDPQFPCYGASEFGCGSLWGVEHGLQQVDHDGSSESAMVRNWTTRLYWAKP